MNAKKSLTLLLLIGVGILVLYLFVLPRWNSFQDKKIRLSQVESEQQKLKAAQEDLEDFLSDFDENVDQAETLKSALPLKQVEYAQILAGLDEMASASGLILGNLSFTDLSDEEIKNKKTNTIQAQQVNISASGSYPSLKNFFLRIENSLRIIDVVDVDLTTDEESGIIQAVMRFNTYYQN
jgi:Tfp pilus assembly protein PilO